MTRLTILFTALILSLSALAHDPKEHEKGAAPDCAAMASMDRSKMNKDDPIMKAMMVRCGSEAMEHEDEDDQDEHEHEGMMKDREHADHDTMMKTKPERE